MRKFVLVVGMVLAAVGTAQGATGGIALTDSGGLKYFVNTDITFSTSSSASAAQSEASYTHSVAATTSGGGTSMSQLSDAFDGYNTLCLSTTGAVGPCETANPDYVVYNKNGKPTTECDGRQIVFNAQVINTGTTTLEVRRKVFVPTNDEFARWLNIVTNTGNTTQSFVMLTSNNLGSDGSTIIDGSSSGNASAEVTDTWVDSFQNYSGNTSSDVRLGHVFQGVGATVGLSGIHFVNGDDNPYWSYSLTLAPGETAVIVNFVTGQPSRAAARAKAAQLATLPPTALQCLTQQESDHVLNFQVGAVPPPQSQPAPAVGRNNLPIMVAILLLTGVIALRRRRIARKS